MKLHDKLLSRKRSIIEAIIDQLKNISPIEHLVSAVRLIFALTFCAV